MDLKLRKRIRKFLEQNSALDINNTAETEALLKQDKKLVDALEAEFFISNTGEKSIFSLFKTIAANIKAKIVVVGSTKGGFISYVLNKRKQKYPTAPLDQRAVANDVKHKIDKSLEKREVEELAGKGASGGKTTYEHESGTLKQEPNKKGDKFSFSVEGKFSGTLEVPRMDKDGNIISGAVDIIDFVDGKVAYMLIATEGICRVNNIDELALQAELIIGEIKKPATREFSTQTDVEPIAPQELTAARNQIASLEQRLDSKDKEIAGVDRERKEAIGALEESKRKIIQLQQSTSADSAKQIAIEREKLGAAEKRIKESDNLVSILRGELGALQKSYGEKVQELENRIREGEDALAAQNEQLATASKNLEDEKAKLAEAQQETEALRAEQDKDKKLLEETRQKLKSINSSVQQKSQSQERQIMAMQDDIAKMTEAIKARDAEIQASTDRYAQEAEILKESNRELEESKQLVQPKIAEMEGELKFAREASKSAQERFDAALGESGDRVKALEDALKGKAQEFTRAQEENARKLLEAQDAAKKIEELRTQGSEAAAKQLEEEQAKLKKLEGELAEGREEYASLTKEVGRLKASHGEELQRLQDQVKQQEARIASQEESLGDQMAASEKKLAEKEAELAKERAEVERLRKAQLEGPSVGEIASLKYDLALRDEKIKQEEEKLAAEKERFKKHSDHLLRENEELKEKLEGRIKELENDAKQGEVAIAETSQSLNKQIKVIQNREDELKRREGVFEAERLAFLPGIESEVAQVKKELEQAQELLKGEQDKLSEQENMLEQTLLLHEAEVAKLKHALLHAQHALHKKEVEASEAEGRFTEGISRAQEFFNQQTAEKEKLRVALREAMGRNEPRLIDSSANPKTSAGDLIMPSRPPNTGRNRFT